MNSYQFRLKEVEKLLESENIMKNYHNKELLKRNRNIEILEEEKKQLEEMMK